MLGVGITCLAAYSIVYINNLNNSFHSSSTYSLRIYLIPFIIFGIALKILSQAIGMYNMYVLKSREAKLKKDRVDAVLALYGITYDIDMQLHPNYRFPQDAQVDLQINNLR